MLDIQICANGRQTHQMWATRRAIHSRSFEDRDVRWGLRVVSAKRGHVGKLHLCYGDCDSAAGPPSLLLPAQGSFVRFIVKPLK